MFTDQYQEHLDSQPDESRWDGFDRGDTYKSRRECIGRLTNKAGQRVAIWYAVTENDGWGGAYHDYEVLVDGDCVFRNEKRNQAIGYARWLMNQCN